MVLTVCLCAQPAIANSSRLSYNTTQTAVFGNSLSKQLHSNSAFSHGGQLPCQYSRTVSREKRECSGSPEGV